MSATSTQAVPEAAAASRRTGLALCLSGDGSFRAGYLSDGDTWPIGRAVAASGAPALLPADPPAAQPPHPERMDEGRARRALRSSHERISLRRLLGRSGGRS